ncbi:MAG: SDR family oxidoreductase [Actinobacteria bacterium]|nr:SDR family oxidoreductase [Actinomycetota bacterium]
MRFDDQTVLVTGAGTGIGAALARGFGSAGATVAVHYNASRDPAEKVVADIEEAGGRGFAVRADLTDAAAPDALVSAVVERVDRVDVLVNNAGDLLERSEVADMSDDVYRGIIALNVDSVFRMCRAAIPGMRDAGRGAIVNVSSIAARTGGGGGSVVYAAAKAAVATLTRGLAGELAGDGIRVNALSPGVIDTPFHERHSDPERLERMVGGIPVGRLGRPDEMVGPVLFLASDEYASYVSGQVLEVNGGQVSP